MKIFGKAADFYRVRMQALVEDALPELNWEDETYGRHDNTDAASPRTTHVVQVVQIDDQRVISLKKFRDRSKAEVFMERVTEDLRELTRNQFEDTHL